MGRVWMNDKPLMTASLDSGALAANDAANYVFSQAVRVCLLSINNLNQPVYVRINSNPTAGVNEASLSTYDFVIPANTYTTKDLSVDDKFLIKEVSLFFPAGSTGVADTGRVMVRGSVT